MKQERPSITAYRTAIMRAAHQIIDNPTVFEDPIASKIIGIRGNFEIRSQTLLRRMGFRLLARAVARAGEPWVNILETSALIAHLRSIGFTQVEDLGPEEMNARYFGNRADRLMVGNFGHLMKAQL